MAEVDKIIELEIVGIDKFKQEIGESVKAGNLLKAQLRESTRTASITDI